MGLSSSGHNKKNAYLRFAKKHITLGFYHIDKNQDPNHLLECEGNTLKHIKIKNLQEIDRAIISKWLHETTIRGSRIIQFFQAIR